MKNPRTQSSVTAFIFLLTACGGGGGSDSSPPSPPPPPPPSSDTYSIGGSVSDLNGTGLVLQNNNSDNLTVNSAGNFSFASEVDSGATYNVTILTQPNNPTQNCTVSNGSGTATSDVSNVVVSCATITANQDSDGDGLSDEEEISRYGTSPNDADTDGDGYTDDNEVLTFDPTVNNFRFNPLVADVPEVKISIAENPAIGANITEQNSSAETVSTSRSQQQSRTSSTTFGTSTTLGVEASQSATVGASTTGPSAEVESSVKVTAEATVSFDSTTSEENRSAWEQMQAKNIEQSTTTSDGFIRVGITVENAGHLSFKVENLDLSASQITGGDRPFSGLPALSYAGGDFPAFDLEQNSSPQSLTYSLEDIDLPTLRSLLTDTRALKIEPGVLVVRNADGETVNIAAEDINRRTAKILIDYGPYAETEFYRAATNTLPDSRGRALSALMAETLRIPYVQDSNGIVSIREIASPTGRWVVTLKRTGDTNLQEITTYDAQNDSYDISTLDIRAFDEVLFVLLEDTDGDGIGYREELLHGTDPNSADSDNDGRSDFDEIREGWIVNAVNAEDPNRYPIEVFSSPTVADYDGDNVNDGVEFDRKLDPYNSDTDGDGSKDDQDNNQNSSGDPITARFPLLLGQNPYDPNSTPTSVEVSGVISAVSPQVIASFTIDWLADGFDLNTDIRQTTASGGQADSFVSPARRFDYQTAGSYTISLQASDDDTPVNSLNQTASVVLTEADVAVEGLGYSADYFNDIHLRTVADIDNDGHDDIIAISNSNTQVVRGSESGFEALEVWSTGHWHPPIFAGVETDPLFFVDIDGDEDLDIVGIDASANELRYALNNGSGFDDPVVWLSGINWNNSLDSAYIVDIDNNGFPDFVHASKADGGVTAYTSSGETLELSKRGTASFASVYPDRNQYPIQLVDVDNDDCADIVLFGVEDTFVARSLCSGSFGEYVSVVKGLSYDVQYRVNQEKRWVEDIDCDGLPDLVAAGEEKMIAHINKSTSTDIDFQRGAVELTDRFVSADGWANNSIVGNNTYYDHFPRYLADVNGDGYKDIIGFGSLGAAVGINRKGLDDTLAFESVRILAPAFDIRDERWWGPKGSGGDRYYGPRLVGDVNGDSRADLIGFSDNEVIYQPIPYVTQFEDRRCER